MTEVHSDSYVGDSVGCLCDMCKDDTFEINDPDAWEALDDFERAPRYLWTFILGAIVLALAIWINFKSAEAQEPPRPFEMERGELMPIHSTVLCDTPKQIEEILKANVKSGFMAGVMVFRKFYAQRNERNEPSCIFLSSAIEIYPSEIISSFTDYHLSDGTTLPLPVNVVAVVVEMGQDEEGNDKKDMLYFLFTTHIFKGEQVGQDA